MNDNQMVQLTSSVQKTLKTIAFRKQQIASIESFVKEAKFEFSNLTDEQKKSIPELEKQIQALKDIVKNAEDNLKLKLEEFGLDPLLEVAKVMNSCGF